MRKIKSSAPQLCEICQGEFKPSQVRVIREHYTFCLECIDMAVMDYFRNKGGSE